MKDSCGETVLVCLPFVRDLSGQRGVVGEDDCAGKGLGEVTGNIRGDEEIRRSIEKVILSRASSGRRRDS
jgi:hypothetical protein